MSVCVPWPSLRIYRLTLKIIILARVSATENDEVLLGRTDLELPNGESWAFLLRNLINFDVTVCLYNVDDRWKFMTYMTKYRKKSDSNSMPI